MYQRQKTKTSKYNRGKKTLKIDQTCERIEFLSHGIDIIWSVLSW